MTKRPATINPYGIRTANPTVWPQYPYNETPETLEKSAARYAIQNDWNQAIAVRELTRGWLRSSHRAVDPERSGVNEPWHPHDRVDPLTPNQKEVLPIDIRPTRTVFGKGHRIRIESQLVDRGHGHRGNRLGKFSCGDRWV